MTLEVDTSSLRGVSAGLKGASTSITGVVSTVESVGSPAAPDVNEGLDALTVAWGAALEVLAEDVSFLGDKVANAANVYDTTDGNLAGGMRPR